MTPRPPASGARGARREAKGRWVSGRERVEEGGRPGREGAFPAIRRRTQASGRPRDQHPILGMSRTSRFEVETRGPTPRPRPVARGAAVLEVPSPAKPSLTAPQPDASGVVGWLWPDSTAQAREASPGRLGVRAAADPALLPYQCLSGGFLGEAVPRGGCERQGFPERSLPSSPLLLLRQTSARAGRLTVAKPHLVPITLDQAFIRSQAPNLGEGGSCLGKASPSACPKTGSKSAISWNMLGAQLAAGVGRGMGFL